MLTPGELRKVCQAATGSLRYMIGLGLYTGMRLGDVVTLRWDAVHADQGSIEITPMKTRRLNKKVRLPIHPVLERPANEHRKRAIVRVGFHSLRHSFVSLCAAHRVPQVAIMELVGHGSPAMTALYSHAGDEQKAKAIAALPAFAFDAAKKRGGKRRSEG